MGVHGGTDEDDSPLAGRDVPREDVALERLVVGEPGHPAEVAGRVDSLEPARLATRAVAEEYVPVSRWGDDPRHLEPRRTIERSSSHDLTVGVEPRVPGHVPVFVVLGPSAEDGPAFAGGEDHVRTQAVSELPVPGDGG